MDDKLVLKNRLKEARAGAEFVSGTAGRAGVGVSRNTISSIETGQFSPTAKLALILCIALDKKFEELVLLLKRPGLPVCRFAVIESRRCICRSSLGRSPASCPNDAKPLCSQDPRLSRGLV